MVQNQTEQNSLVFPLLTCVCTGQTSLESELPCTIY